ncbi:MAG: DMT family transporter [Chromatiaceae bacterium]|nr:MAG: DMT family transporter [Chromatiaceae bacterium]
MSSRPPPQQILLGALFIVLGELCFASMGVGIRMAAGELPNAMIVFGRNAIGLALLAPWLLRHGLRDVRTAVPCLHLLRAGAGVAAMYCFFYAIAMLPLGEAMLLKLTAPMFMPLIALLWLREQVSALLWVALGIGFAGVVVILQPDPDLGGVSPVALVGLLGGLLAALAKVTVRRLTRTEPARRIVFYFALIAGIISAIPLAWDWQTPSPASALWLVGIGLIATLGQFALTRGLALASAARMGVFVYSSVIFGAAFGWLLWEEPVTWTLVAGSLAIGVAGLLASRARSCIQATAPAAPGPRAAAPCAAASRDLGTDRSPGRPARAAAPSPIGRCQFDHGGPRRGHR